jgi:hypothetical protein
MAFKAIDSDFIRLGLADNDGMVFDNATHLGIS